MHVYPEVRNTNSAIISDIWNVPNCRAWAWDLKIIGFSVSGSILSPPVLATLQNKWDRKLQPMVIANWICSIFTGGSCYHHQSSSSAHLDGNPAPKTGMGIPEGHVGGQKSRQNIFKNMYAATLLQLISTVYFWKGSFSCLPNTTRRPKQKAQHPAGVSFMRIHPTPLRHRWPPNTSFLLVNKPLYTSDI